MSSEHSTSWRVSPACMGTDFYGLPRNIDTVTLVRESWDVPASLPLGDQTIVPLRAGESIQWRVV